MINEEKLEKLILGGPEDMAIANEYIKEYKLCIIPKEFENLDWGLNATHFYYHKGNMQIYRRSIKDNTWSMYETSTTSTTTKI